MSDALPRPAATVLVLRDADDAAGFEVLMLRRHSRAGFAADMWVFPGGVVDPADAQLPADRWTGIDPDALAPRFNATPAEVLAFHVAAVRETFEEAGLLLAVGADGSAPDLADPQLLQLRHDLADRNTQASFGAWLETHDLVLELGSMTYLSHWVTPTVEPRRYDARFFVARVPRLQTAAYDQLETTDERWISPADALAALAAGTMKMIFPTIRTLQDLAEHATASEVIAAASAQPSIRRVQPHAELDEQGRFVRVLHPDDPEFPADLYRDSA